MKLRRLFSLALRPTTVGAFLVSGFLASAQTNVYDDVIALSPNHTYLKAALDQEGLDVVLQNPAGTFTVFAPTNDAFDDLATELNTNIAGLLALGNLSDILLYHVLGTTVPASAIDNGDIVTPVNTDNTIKLTKTAAVEVFANQAQVNVPDLSTDNGVVHSIDAVILPSETVVDVALDNGFTTLATAAITAELLPVLTDPFATFTIFAPTNDAFDALATELNTNINGLLALPNLAEILTYHALGSEVLSSALNNGDIVTPLFPANTLKVTVNGDGDVFVNQAEVTLADVTSDNGVVHVVDAVLLSSETVLDVAIDNGFSTLVTALSTAYLFPAATDPFATLTVFAPSNAAFNDLAAALNTDINGLLALPNLADVLTYHVLGSEVLSTAISNGDIVDALNTENTLKLTVTSASEVFVNQAQVTAADVTATNGVVHVIDAVLLPTETVVDVAIDNGFTTLTTAVVTAELLPALTDPFGTFTVFAPTNDAFDDLATGLGVDLTFVLGLPNLADILTYHVLGSEVLSGDLTNGAIVDALSTTNTIKVTVGDSGDAFVNQANISAVDITTGNGVVHVLDAVILPFETVVDVAIDNDFTSLVAALTEAELLPAVTNPFAELTVFAPTNEAFDALAASLGTDVAGLLALEGLSDILLYHVVDGFVLSSELVNGDVPTLQGSSVTIDITDGVKVNNATVILADVTSDNGVVHVIDAVLLPAPAGVNDVKSTSISMYPNPATDVIFVKDQTNGRYEIIDINGSVILQGVLTNDMIQVSNLAQGAYMVRIQNDAATTVAPFIKQ